MWYCESGPDADQTDNNDGPEADELTCDDSSGRNAPGKEESQEKRVINIRGCKGCYARGQHSQILIHAQPIRARPAR
jgi:hypothetical protein